MKLLVMGATGRTGQRIAALALKKGHQVTAIARDPEKLIELNAEIIQGTPYDSGERSVRAGDHPHFQWACLPGRAHGYLGSPPNSCLNQRWILCNEPTGSANIRMQ